MYFLRTLLLASLTSAAFAQTPPARLEFEVASVKPSQAVPLGNAVNIGVKINGAQVHINSLSLKDYIRYAYRVEDYQVSGPDWLAGERYEIDAKLPAGATRDQVPDMMQALLADRFELKLHRGSKEFPVYALIVLPGGLKMAALQADPEDANATQAVEVSASGGPQGVAMNWGRGSSFNFADNKFVAKKLSMRRLADSLARYMDRPVIDFTGLTANYDFTLPLTEDDYRTLLIRSAINAGIALPPAATRLLDGATDESLHSSLKALGLKLDSRKAPLEVLLIDHARKVPTEN